MKFNLLTFFGLLCINFNVCGNQFGYESHEVFVNEVSSGYEKTYQDVLNQYDKHLLTNPDDILALTEKCQFIDRYSYAESDLLYFESLSDDLTACQAQIENHSENHPDRILYDISQLWGDEATEKYDQILNSGIDQWTDQQKTRFFQWMENAQRWSDTYDSGIPHAAYLETRESQFALGAAIHEFELGNKERTLELLVFEQAKTVGDREKLARLYVDLGMQDQAKDLLAKVESESGADVVEIIKLNSSVDGQFVPTSEQINEIKESWQGEVKLQKLFEYFLKKGRSDLANNIYQAWAGNDIWQDPFKHHKFQLYKTTSKWGWDVQDFYAILVWMAVTAICFLLTCIIIAPIHYRGLYRRVHGKKPLESITDWNLKHALFLGTMFSLVGTVLYILFQHEAFYSSFFMDEEMPFSTENGLNSKIYIFNAIIMLVSSLLIFKHGISLFKISVVDFFKTFLATLAVFVLFKFVMVAGLFGVKLWTLSAAFDLVQFTISDIYINYGTFAAFFSIALITPIIEEYLFRGVLLNSFTKHISFGWANIIQAAIFALVHDNPDFYIHHFIMGLIVGYLVKTQKHIYGAILFHVFNNILAVSVLVKVM